jgi:hypothetical protein
MIVADESNAKVAIAAAQAGILKLMVSPRRISASHQFSNNCRMLDAAWLPTRHLRVFVQLP